MCVVAKTPTVPPVGLRFIDAEGKHWIVDNVIRSQSLPDYFLVRLAVGATRECAEETLVLAPMEFDALIRSRKLVPEAPDVVPKAAYTLTDTNEPGASADVRLN
jgi:hypothetical protein